MKEQLVFENRAKLEDAYHRGHLRKGVHYRVSDDKNTYRLSVSRKGIAEIRHRG